MNDNELTSYTLSIVRHVASYKHHLNLGRGSEQTRCTLTPRKRVKRGTPSAKRVCPTRGVHI
jgi:hypothetical protein